MLVLVTCIWIYPYRGKKAFCSREGRYQEMIWDKGIVKCTSGSSVACYGEVFGSVKTHSYTTFIQRAVKIFSSQGRRKKLFWTTEEEDTLKMTAWTTQTLSEKRWRRYEAFCNYMKNLPARKLTMINRHHLQQECQGGLQDEYKKCFECS